MSLIRNVGLSCAATVLLASCGGGAESSGETATTDTTSGAETEAHSAESTETPSPPEAWESMSHQDQAAWMGQEVVPRMRHLFREFDGDRYAQFNCGTCHGPGATEGDFEMPSASLPALYDTGTPEQQQMVREYPEMVRFMFQRVYPEMQTLVGGADYDEETHEGFSCYSCHPHAGDEGTTPVRLGETDAAPDPEPAAEGDAG